ncbi:keratin, type I cytoskeletal 19-like [Pseudophryne corroboree]|uniref:keratin, type I cytoskeletal 19-like n=1 Tax=Pseudophryne corroboree TaxID=495146 RepID=UPI003081B720
MQLLNDRLATYLEKVHSLEEENAHLERKICEWYEKNAHTSLPDFQHYYQTIEELQHKIFEASVENAKIVLQIDNARLAADDFKNKYEIEVRLRNFVETDLNGLRKVLEGLNIERGDLEMQLENLQDKLLQMKKHQEEDVICLRNQLGARINVQVDAAPSVDLNRVLCEVREQYENLMDRNLKEVESMFIARSEELNNQVASGSEQLQSVQTEVIDLKRCMQTLEIELQTQLSMKSALECTLAETEASFSSQLSHLQILIDNVEEQLSQIRSDLERQIHEYKILMDQTTHLEMEITTYKRLLEGQDMHIPEHRHHDKASKESKYDSHNYLTSSQSNSSVPMNLIMEKEVSKARNTVKKTSDSLKHDNSETSEESDYKLVIIDWENMGFTVPGQNFSIDIDKAFSSFNIYNIV